jgi:putative FmdB family regulatory protein
MPLWDFTCPNCETVVECLAKHDEKIECEQCGAVMRKLIGRPGGFQFKGNGFYATDYKKGSYADDNKRAADRLAETNPDSPAMEQD